MATIVSIASGKGGVGKSVLCADLGAQLARRGLRVVLADLDMGGAGLSAMYGLFQPRFTLADFLARRVDDITEVAEEVPSRGSLRVLVGTGESLTTANPAHASKHRLLRHLHKIDADVLLFDIGAGCGLDALDFFLAGQERIVVATPDPTSIMAVHRFIKLASIRKVTSAFSARTELRRLLAAREFESLDEILAAVGTTTEHAEQLAREQIADFKPMVLLNRVEEGCAINVRRLHSLLQQYVGAELEVLGNIPEDRSVHHAVRRFTPVSDHAPDCDAARATGAVADALARRLRETAAAASCTPSSVFGG